MSKFGAVKIEGNPSNPKVVSEPKLHSIKSRHLDLDDTFVFKKMMLTDEDTRELFKVKIKNSKLEIEGIKMKIGKDGMLEELK